MKRMLLLIVLVIASSCNKKVGYYDLKNENETYYMGDEPFTGQAVSDTQSKIPSTVYEFIEGQKQSEIEYYADWAGGKMKYEKHFSMRVLEHEKEYSKDGLLLRKVDYVWDDAREKAEVYIEWYDWCGKMNRRKSLTCDKYFGVLAVNYDQSIPQPCN